MDAGRRFDVPHDAAQGTKRPRLRQWLRALLCLPLPDLQLIASRLGDEFWAQTLPASLFALPLKHGETPFPSTFHQGQTQLRTID